MTTVRGFSSGGGLVVVLEPLDEHRAILPCTPGRSHGAADAAVARAGSTLEPMVVSRMTDQVGRVLGGRYRLIAPIGTGASALVFLADDTRLRRRVAVKVLHQALADDEAFLRRFRAEAQAAAALNHPNVLAVYDWGEDDASPYLVTEYLGGGSLRGMLDRGRRLSPSQALLVGLEAARGLDYAHRAASSTATSSRPTCCSARRAACASPTSGWPAPWPRRRGPSRRARARHRPLRVARAGPRAARRRARATSTRSPSC